MFTGKQIRDRRKADGLTAQELADLLSVKVDNVYKWEKWTRPNNPEDYIKIENWLAGKVESVPHGTSLTEKSTAYDALFSVLIADYAAWKAQQTGENPEVITRKIYKAAEDVQRLG